MTYFEGGLRTHALKIEFGLRHPQTLGEMFKTTKHIALAIEQANRKVNLAKNVVTLIKLGSLNLTHF